jgi:hypothetical protein
MNNNVSNTALTEEEYAAARECFVWWASLGTPHTQGLAFDDWDVARYKDAFWFWRKDGTPDAHMIRGKTTMHFGFDTDTLESAYNSMPQKQWRLQLLFVENVGIIHSTRECNIDPGITATFVPAWTDSPVVARTSRAGR